MFDSETVARGITEHTERSRDEVSCGQAACFLAEIAAGLAEALEPVAHWLDLPPMADQSYLATAYRIQRVYGLVSLLRARDLDLDADHLMGSDHLPKVAALRKATRAEEEFVERMAEALGSGPGVVLGSEA